MSELNVVITAAGSSRRMGGINKMLIPLGNMPVLARTALVFEKWPPVRRIVVSAPSQCVAQYEELLRSNGVTKLAKVVAGGSERQYSIHNALRALVSLGASLEENVAVHDGARPLISLPLLDRLAAALAEDGVEGVIPGVPVKDTIKRLDKRGMVLETLVRAELTAVQTPQIFNFGQLLRAYEEAEAAHYVGTDDASLMERIGAPVKVVEGDYRNIKVTTAEDVDSALKFWEQMSAYE